MAAVCFIKHNAIFLGASPAKSVHFAQATKRQLAYIITELFQTQELFVFFNKNQLLAQVLSSEIGRILGLTIAQKSAIVFTR